MPYTKRKSKIATRIAKNKSNLIDGAILCSVTISFIVYAYQFRLLPAPGLVEPIEKTIELNEALAIAVVFLGGLAFFCYRRVLDTRVESRRRMEAEREARTLAFSDALTGLPNRRQFEAAIKIAVEAAPGRDASHALLLLDLNGFKRVNDLFGHGVGDEVLIQIGSRFTRALRQGESIARLGGDEFAVLALHLAGPEAAMGLARRLMQAVDAPILAGGFEHRLGVAIGVCLTSSEGSLPDEVIRKADIALYRAKEDKVRSPSSVRFFVTEMDAHIRERDTIERELRTALNHAEIRPHYQPLIGIADGTVVGFEALARWTSPTLGVVPPSRFIPVAEDTGLIIPLSELLFEQACIDARGWPNSIHLAFNVSGALLQSETFSLRMLAILARTGLPASRVELEITETALVRDLAGARRVLGELRAGGMRIALDDFGTGYSSLYHLRALKPDKIKIDRSFVDGMENDPDNAAIVKALIGLGVGLGATVTAEGVETIQQEAILREHGCNQGQGYHYSAAVDATSALALVQSSGPSQSVA